MEARTWSGYAGGGQGYRRSGRSVIFSIAWTIDMTGSFNQSYFCTIDGQLKVVHFFSILRFSGELRTAIKKKKVT